MHILRICMRRRLFRRATRCGPKRLQRAAGFVDAPPPYKPCVFRQPPAALSAKSARRNSSRLRTPMLNLQLEQQGRRLSTRLLPPFAMEISCAACMNSIVMRFPQAEHGPHSLSLPMWLSQMRRRTALRSVTRSAARSRACLAIFSSSASGS